MAFRGQTRDQILRFQRYCAFDFGDGVSYCVLRGASLDVAPYRTSICLSISRKLSVVLSACVNVIAGFPLSAISVSDGCAKVDLNDPVVLKLRADQGSILAQFLYGTSLLLGRGIRQDLVAADQNDVSAQGNYTGCLRSGRVSQLQLNLPPIRIMQLGKSILWSLSEGIGVPVDFVAAAHYYQLAADHNHPLAQFIYGIYLCEGFGVGFDSVKGCQYLGRSADQCFGPAEAAFGICNEFGLGMSQNERMASIYYQCGLNDHDNDSMNNFGHCLEFGQGIEIDQSRAATCYRFAADCGHPGAQNNIGFCLQHGLGVVLIFLKLFIIMNYLRHKLTRMVYLIMDYVFTTESALNLILNQHYLIMIKHQQAAVLITRVLHFGALNFMNSITSVQ
jgi:TPR repeat protein